ncbi:hypothetical protein MRX96_015370 [Rhipicephalus microplus]
MPAGVNAKPGGRFVMFAAAVAYRTGICCITLCGRCAGARAGGAGTRNCPRLATGLGDKGRMALRCTLTNWSLPSLVLNTTAPCMMPVRKATAFD